MQIFSHKTGAVPQLGEREARPRASEAGTALISKPDRETRKQPQSKPAHKSVNTQRRAEHGGWEQTEPVPDPRLVLGNGGQKPQGEPESRMRAVGPSSDS